MQRSNPRGIPSFQNSPLVANSWSPVRPVMSHHVASRRPRCQGDRSPHLSAICRDGCHCSLRQPLVESVIIGVSMPKHCVLGPDEHFAEECELYHVLMWDFFKGIPETMLSFE